MKYEKLYDLLADKTLSFGCVVEINGMKEVVGMADFYQDGQDKGYSVLEKGGGRLERDMFDKYGEQFTAEIHELKDIKIIGHPITKAQVEKFFIKHLDKYSENLFTELKNRWNYLKPDNLKEQSNELKDWLCELFGIEL